MIADILSGLLAVNLAAGAAILVVLLVRRSARRLFGARAAYALWLAVPVAAIAVLLPRPALVAALPTPPVGEIADAIFFVFAPSEASAAPGVAGPDLSAILAALWLAGAIAFLIAALAAHRRGVARFGRLTPSDGVLRAANTGLGPALIGGLRPRLVLPADFETRFDAREQALVLAHERAHLAAGDTFTNTLIVLFSCLNWFNPLVHIAAHFARVDQELACDAAVAERFPGERRTYAEALLKTQLAAAPLPLGCYWPGRSSSLLTERIEMLAFKNTPIRRIAGGLALALLCGGAGYAAWAAQPPKADESQLALPETVNLSNSGGALTTFPVRNPVAVLAGIRAGDVRGVLLAGGAAADTVAAMRTACDQRPQFYCQSLADMRGGTEMYLVNEEGVLGVSGVDLSGNGRIGTILPDGAAEGIPYPSEFWDRRNMLEQLLAAGVPPESMQVTRNEDGSIRRIQISEDLPVGVADRIRAPGVPGPAEP